MKGVFMKRRLISFYKRYPRTLFAFVVLGFYLFSPFLGLASTDTVKTPVPKVPPVSLPVQVQPTIGINVRQEITLNRPTPVYSPDNRLLGKLYPDRKFKLEKGGKKSLETASFEAIEMLMLNNYNLQVQYQQLWNTYQALLKEKTALESKPKPKKKSKK